MRAIPIDVPLGLTIMFRTRVPGRLWIGSSPRNPASNASNPSSFNRRPQSPSDKHSAESPSSSPEDRCSNTIAPTGLKRVNSRSSQRTEPAYSDDWDPAEWIPYFEEHDIKVRDFCFEPFPTSKKAIEIFDPCLALLKYERMVKMRAREIKQLYDVRWLTEEQARSRLPPEEWPSLGKPSEYPWTPLKIDKPTGTRDEIIAALRLHLKRTYSDINFDSSAADSPDMATSFDDDQLADIRSLFRNADEIEEGDINTEMAGASSEATHSGPTSGATAGPLQTGGYPGSARDALPSNHHPGVPDGVNAETGGSFSSISYRTPSQTLSTASMPTLSMSTSSGTPPSGDSFGAPSQPRPRGLSRTQTLRTL